MRRVRADRSRSANRAPKPKRPPVSKEPPDPDSILLRDAVGWSIREAGGEGDCGFRACAVAIGANQSKNFTPEEAKREGAKLRLYAVAHLRKHCSQYSQWFAVDTAEGSQAWGNQQAPQNFDDFVTALAHAGVWIDNLSLTALAERIGIAIVTWIWDDATGTWYRSVSAPWFKDQVAQCAKELKPIVLVLRAQHFRALVPDSVETSCPREWLLETEWRPVHALRGAGKSLSLPPSTPVKRSASGGLSILSRTPSKGGGRSKTGISAKDRKVPARSVSVKGPAGIKQSSAAKSSVVSKKRTTKTSQGPETPTARTSRPSLPKVSADEGPAEVTRNRVVAAKPKTLGIPNLPVIEAPIPQGPVVWWTCNIPGCGFQVFQKPGVQGHSHYRKVHLRDVHGISKAPSLRGSNDLSTKHRRISNQMAAYDVRWDRWFQELVKVGWWEGAHTFTKANPDAWREYKKGKDSAWRPLHTCDKCKRQVSRCEFTTSPCSEAKGTLNVAKAKKV